MAMTRTMIRAGFMPKISNITLQRDPGCKRHTMRDERWSRTGNFSS